MKKKLLAIVVILLSVISGTTQSYNSSAIQKKTETSSAGMRLSSGNILYDFTREYFGRLRVNMSGMVTGDSVVIYIGEKLGSDGSIDRNPGGTIRTYRYRLIKEANLNQVYIPNQPDKRNTTGNAIRLPEFMGIVAPFRYVEVERSAQRVGISREIFYYRFNDNAAYFSSSDSVLNAIWDLSKHTIKATSFTGLYIDGDRERIPYEADALINQLSHYALDTVYSIARNTFAYLLKHPTWPTEWHLQTHQIAWYDYWYTGNIDLIKNNYDFLKLKTLDAFRQPNGLISTTASPQRISFLDSIYFTTFDAKQVIRDITDWPQKKNKIAGPDYPGEADGFVFCDYNSVVNAYYYKSLLLMKEFASLLGKQEDVVFYNQRAKEVYKAFNDGFVNPDSGLVRDGDTSAHTSFHANFFALCFGLVQEQHKAAVLRFLLSKNMACSVYGSQFLLDALYNEGMGDYALTLLTKRDERSWYHMLELGAGMTMEAWDLKYKPNLDWNHAWGAAPTNLIAFRLMGIQPQSAGFNEAIIKPAIGNLSYSVIRMPTAKGEVYEKITQNPKQYQLTLRLPKGMTGTLVLPDFISEIQNVSVKGTNIKPVLQNGKVIFNKIKESIVVTVKK
ncbi:MAG: alpha-L-rhamnosidase [Sediminibacterium sp.]|nr:alpha-L-rhamnosidase [Sediminibacterium sp.]